MTLTPAEFVQRWRGCALSERSAAQSHFLDLCEMLGVPHPVASDAIGEHFTFEKFVGKARGGKGFADVWKRDRFAWEYKCKHKNLDKAYRQLNDYREELGNPPLLIVCDLDRFQVHTNFTATYKRVYEFSLEELGRNQVTPTCPIAPLEVLRALFGDYNVLRPERTDAQVTEDAARLFGRLAERLELEDRNLGASREQVAHFLMRLLFCLFADSIGLLPDHVFRNLVHEDRLSPKRFLRKLRLLFEAMSEPDGIFGEHTIKYFNGGLFDTNSILDLDAGDLGILYEVTRNYDWSHIAPAIFGTLFQRSLDPQRRSLIGAHYTSEEDILLLIEPVLIQPLQRRWEEVKSGIEELIRNSSPRRGCPAAATMLSNWIKELTSVHVLDPACGSGNFLYVALRRMLDLWLESRNFGIEKGISLALPDMVSPQQLYGIETDFYARELASVVVWIGFLQWKHEHSVREDREPVLQKLTNIEHGDAILRRDQSGKLFEPSWPKVDFIVGNPPFLGGKRLRRGLGDQYVNDLFSMYEGRVKAECDLVVYWFEKARALVSTTGAKRAGLLATQSIRGGANRSVLEKISETSKIFWGWSDREWSLEGAAVHVSMVGFGTSDPAEIMLNGQPVAHINPDLTSGTDLTSACVLGENSGVCFMGTTKGGAFEIEPDLARKMLTTGGNPNRKPNSDVVRPWINAKDIAGMPRRMYVIDFGTTNERDASLYELPFEYIRKHVFPERRRNRRAAYAQRWWLHAEPRPELRKAVEGLSRILVTPRVSVHRLFAWVPVETLPDSATFAFARDDDYFFGVLHSSIHEVWARAQGTQLREVSSGFRYTPSSTFETFPFPWPLGTEPNENEDRRVSAISKAARELVELRDRWLLASDIPGEERKSRTLTLLYNARPAWLESAHVALDRAVFAAYGLKYPLERTEVLERLLTLNSKRASVDSLRPALTLVSPSTVKERPRAGLGRKQPASVLIEDLKDSRLSSKSGA